MMGECPDIGGTETGYLLNAPCDLECARLFEAA